MHDSLSNQFLKYLKKKRMDKNYFDKKCKSGFVMFLRMKYGKRF